MKTYNVTAKRWKHGWELHIDDVGVTQSKTLAGAEKMVRDYIALDLDVPEDSFDALIVVELDERVAAAIDRAKVAVADAASAQLAAANLSRRVVHWLKDDGLSGQDVAILLGVSPQRVSQLASSGPSRRGASVPDEVDELGAGVFEDIQGIEDAIAAQKARRAGKTAAPSKRKPKAELIDATERRRRR